MQRWPLSIAAAWVLTREEQFVEGCYRAAYNPTLNPVENDATDWRRNTKVGGHDLNRRPVMLFPSAEAASLRLRTVLSHDQWDFSRDEVLSSCPPLDGDQASVMASVWRGQDPEKHKRIPLSHAAWWIASERASQIFALDDRTIWAPAFTSLLCSIVDRQVRVSANDPSPARSMDAALFDLADAAGTFPIDFPARASEGFGGPPYRPGYGAFIACDLLAGDRYYTANTREPAWSGLQLLSADLLQLFSKSKSLAKPLFVEQAQVNEWALAYVKSLPEGKNPNEKKMWEAAKIGIPGAKYKQVITAKNEISPNPGRGRIKSKDKIQK
jgi:hypothetical protein